MIGRPDTRRPGGVLTTRLNIVRSEGALTTQQPSLQTPELTEYNQHLTARPIAAFESPVASLQGNPL